MYGMLKGGFTRRAVSFFVAVFCLVTLLPALATAARAEDIPPDGGKVSVNCVVSEGYDSEVPPMCYYRPPHYAYIIGYADGTVRPNALISRAEVVTVFFRLLDDEVREQYWTQTNDFKDVKLSDWFNNAISVIANMGIINGYSDEHFKPDNNITRGEFAKIATEFALFAGASPWGKESFSDISGHWAEEYIEIAASTGWIVGYPDGTYRPDELITRAEFMTAVNHMLGRVPQNEEDLLPNMIKFTDNANPNKWYYFAVQEATNSHESEDKEDSNRDLIMIPGLEFPYEYWTELLTNRDWAALERQWSNANS